MCRAVIAAAMQVYPPMVADAIDAWRRCGVVTYRPSPGLGFVDKLLFASFWIHQINGRKASEFPLLRDTAVGKTYPGVMSVQGVPFAASQPDPVDCPTLGDPLSHPLTYSQDDLANLLYLSPSVVCFPPPSQRADLVFVVTMRTNDRPRKEAQVCFAFHLGSLRSRLTKAQLEQAKSTVSRDGMGMGAARRWGPRGKRTRAMAALVAESPVVGWVISLASNLSRAATTSGTSWRRRFDAMICVGSSAVRKHRVLRAATMYGGALFPSGYDSSE